ncbi:NOT2-3-5 domain-containing protein [Aphelenchoides bicaudatus]|nr:NOT2-3-5 domain-containing protein [Aphelenchoides bicaudatus]
MRASSMSSGTTLLASRGPQTQPQQTIGSNSVANPNLISQLPNPNLLKSAASAQNAAKMFTGNGMPSLGLNSSQRNTPPSMSTFHNFPMHRTTTNPQQRLVGFSSGMDSPLNNDVEFPSLNTRSSPAPHNVSNNLFAGQPQLNMLQQQSMMFPPSSTAAKDALSMQHRMPYANMMRGVENSGYGQSEFSLQSEDFPALPGAQQLLQSQLGNSGATGQNFSESQLMMAGQTNLLGGPIDVRYMSDFFTNGASENGNPLNINVNNGVVTNIPSGMLCDQYGIVGLLTFLKGLDQYPGLNMLSLGIDITKLGLNMSSSGSLYQNFGGPWADQPCRTQDYEAKVPEEYLTNSIIRDKLPTIKVNKLSEDILFYLFYNCPGQVYQLAAASELYQRDWRYHKVDAVWLTRSVYGGMKEQTPEYETGSYNIFDPLQWRKIPKEMRLEYKMLEGKPVHSVNGPNLLNSNGSLTTPGQATTPSFAGTQQQPPTNMAAHFAPKNI